jgi:hypothetical protein
MIVRACDFALVLLRDEKDLVRGFSSRAMRRVRVTTPSRRAGTERLRPDARKFLLRTAPLSKHLFASESGPKEDIEEAER